MVSFQEEQFKKFFDDGQELFVEHYKELALNQDLIPLELDVTRYLEGEEKGALHIATLRDDGKLVGYFVSWLLPHLHYASVLCASTDMYWIKPEYRKVCGMSLIKFVEICWQGKGVKKAYISCKTHLDKQGFFEALGYTFSDKMFIRTF